MNIFSKILKLQFFKPADFATKPKLSNLNHPSGLCNTLREGAKVPIFDRQNRRNFDLYWLVLTSVFSLCFMSVYIRNDQY